MNVLRRVTIGLLAATVAAAQAVLDDPQKIADAQKLFDSVRGSRAECEVIPGFTGFGFSLRLQSGYHWRLRASESQAAGRKWIALTRVTPQEGSRKPFYLSEVVQFPDGNAIAPLSQASHFWVGEGRYAVKFLTFDDSGHACRAEWRIDARLNATERKIEPLLDPDTVAGPSWSEPVRAARKNVANLGRLTILLDVADQATSADQLLLLDALTALINELPARPVRVVLFDLTQQKEIFRRDDFTSDALPEVAKAMLAVQFEPVNVHALQTPVDLIENLANQEIRSPKPSSAVVFLGLRSIYHEKPSPTFGQMPGPTPQFFYIVCPALRTYESAIMPNVAADGGWNLPRPVDGTADPTGRFPGRSPLPVLRPRELPGTDSIEYALKQLGGKTLKIDSPDSFAKAVTEIRRSIGANR